MTSDTMTATIAGLAEALKPCPFCGGKAESIEIEVGRWGDALSDIVCCNTCDAQTDRFRTSDDAIAAWNRRPLEALANRGDDKEAVAWGRWSEINQKWFIWAKGRPRGAEWVPLGIIQHDTSNSAEHKADAAAIPKAEPVRVRELEAALTEIANIKAKLPEIGESPALFDKLNRAVKIARSALQQPDEGTTR